MSDPAELLLDAALPHVAFDGWSEETFRAAVQDSQVNPTVAWALFPRGAVDLAVAYHRKGDAEMTRRLAETDMTGLRFRDKVALAVKLRVQAAEDREVVRRGTVLFALPMYAADGAKLIWGTADAIWTALGDSSQDFNWYTKRMTLSAVYSSVILYWLGDDSDGAEATWAFLDRRIENVMQFEKMKAGMRDNKLLGGLMAGPARLLERVRAPQGRDDLPGGWTPGKTPRT